MSPIYEETTRAAKYAGINATDYTIGRVLAAAVARRRARRRRSRSPEEVDAVICCAYGWQGAGRSE